MGQESLNILGEHVDRESQHRISRHLPEAGESGSSGEYGRAIPQTKAERDTSQESSR